MRFVRTFSLFIALLMLLSCFALAEPADSTTDSAQTAPKGQVVKPVPMLRGRNILLLNLETGKALYEKDIDDTFYPSNTVKLMTAVLALENIINFQDKAEVSVAALDGTSGTRTVSLKEGEVLTLDELMYCMMIRSANDAANVIAEYVSGGVDKFVAKMNDRARELGMTSTHYDNAHGLFTETSLTSVRDISKLVRHAMTLDGFMTYCNTNYKRIPATNLSKERYLITLNYLIANTTQTAEQKYVYKQAEGIQVGGSKEYGYNAITRAASGNTSYLCIVCRADADEATGTVNSFTDVKALCDWAFENYKYGVILKKDEFVVEAPVELAQVNNHIKLIARDEIVALLPKALELDDFERVMTVQEEIQAPVEDRQKLGELVLKYDGVVYGRTDLLADGAVERSGLLYGLSQIEAFFSSLWVKIVLISLLGLLLIYVLLVLLVNRNRRRRRKQRKKSSQAKVSSVGRRR